MVLYKGGPIEEGLSKVIWARNVYVKTLGTTLEDEFNYSMRMFVLETNGYIPLHVHTKAFHLQYLLMGSMRVEIDNEVHDVAQRDVVYIPSKAKHRYINTNNGRTVFICVTPLFEDDRTDILERI
ncbi:MAG: cupin domain-containing protein [Candidatus Geothermarchaeota archaeon]